MVSLPESPRDARSRLRWLALQPGFHPHDLHPENRSTRDVGSSEYGKEGSMRRSRFGEEQIIAILKQAEAGKSIRGLCREQGITDQTYYRWKAKYGGLEVSDVRRLRQLEDENPQAEASGG